MALSKDEIMDKIKREILMLTLAPGMPLDEASLSAHFQISRTLFVIFCAGLLAKVM